MEGLRLLGSDPGEDGRRVADAADGLPNADADREYFTFLAGHWEDCEIYETNTSRCPLCDAFVRVRAILNEAVQANLWK